MRILSIDYGKKRTGIAVTDPLQIIAGGLATVSTSELYDFLVGYVAREPVERIVIGEPRQADGSPSENYARVLGANRAHRKDDDIHRAALHATPVEVFEGSG